VLVVVQALLENTTAQVISLAPHRLPRSLEERAVSDARLASRLGKSGGLEDSGIRIRRHGAV
jgi:hypothetical protein